MSGAMCALTRDAAGPKDPFWRDATRTHVSAFAVCRIHETVDPAGVGGRRASHRRIVGRSARRWLRRRIRFSLRVTRSRAQTGLRGLPFAVKVTLKKSVRSIERQPSADEHDVTSRPRSNTSHQRCRGSINASVGSALVAAGARSERLGHVSRDGAGIGHGYSSMPLSALLQLPPLLRVGTRGQPCPTRSPHLQGLWIMGREGFEPSTLGLRDRSIQARPLF